MLFIIFGGEFKTGYDCRRILKSKGFDVIKKYNYVKGTGNISRDNYEKPEGVYQDWFDDKEYVDEKRVNQCDYRYDLGDIILGFSQAQIMDAIHGERDAVLTVGASSMKFIEQMKVAFGGYVTAIFLYIDKNNYLRLIKEHPEITETEVKFRSKSYAKFNEIYLNKKHLFDDIVICGDDDGQFNEAGLETQLDSIINKSKQIEKSMNALRYVDLPYVGSKPYVFISYSHADTDKVYPILSMLQRKGFRIWYDEGIEGGAEWRVTLRSKIEACSCFLLFSSENSASSVNVVKELTTAQIFGKAIVTVKLDDAVFSDTDEAELSRFQKVDARHPDFENKIARTIPEECSENPG